MRLVRSIAPIAIAILLLWSGPSGASGKCLVYRYDAPLNAESEVRMIVESGQDCRVQFPVDQTTRVDTNEITAYPRYGGVRVHGTTGAYYRSNPGYRGPDRFSFTFCGADAAQSGCADILVRISVR